MSVQNFAPIHQLDVEILGLVVKLDEKSVITKVSWIYLVENMNVWMRCHRNPSDICRDISVRRLNTSPTARSLFQFTFTVTPNSTWLNVTPWRTLWKRQTLPSVFLMFSCTDPLKLSGVCEVVCVCVRH